MYGEAMQDAMDSFCGDCEKMSFEEFQEQCCDDCDLVADIYAKMTEEVDKLRVKTEQQIKEINNLMASVAKLLAENRNLEGQIRMAKHEQL